MAQVVAHACVRRFDSLGVNAPCLFPGSLGAIEWSEVVVRADYTCGQLMAFLEYMDGRGGEIASWLGDVVSCGSLWLSCAVIMAGSLVPNVKYAWWLADSMWIVALLATFQSMACLALRLALTCWFVLFHALLIPTGWSVFWLEW